MRRLPLIILSVTALFLAASCDKKQFESMYDKQESYIEAITENLMSTYPDATLTHEDGIVRITVAHGDGATLAENGAVAFYYAGYYLSSSRIDNSTLFVTNYEELANSARWSISDTTAFQIRTIRLDESDLVEGLKKGLPGVKGGDECYILFNGKRGFGKKKIANVPSNAALAWHLWIKSVSD